MIPYYHVTHNGNIKQILKEGLKKGADLGYEPSRWNNSKCDNNFVYISKTPDNLLKWGPNMNKRVMSLITLSLSDKYLLERDLDCSVIIAGDILGGYITLKKILQKTNLYLEEEMMDITRDKKQIEGIFSRLSDNEWDNIFGFYRTSENIPPNSIIRIDSCEIDYVLNRKELLKMIMI